MSEKKQQGKGSNIKTGLNAVQKRTEVKERYNKHINKNAKSIMKEAAVLNKNILDIEGGEIEIIKIIRGDDDTSSALMDMEIILRCFNRYPVLFWSGDMYIHLQHDKLMYAEVLSNIHAKTIPFKRLVDIGSTDQTFVAVGTNGDKVDVLPKNAMTYPLFDKLGILEKSKHSKVLIEFKDLLPIYYKEKKRKRKNISGNSNSKQIKHISNRYNHGTISIRTKRRLKASCPRKANRLGIYKQYPIEDELFHLPIQATADDLDNELEQQVPSEVTPSLYYAIDQPFASHVNIPTDDAPSRQREFHHVYHASGQPTNLYTNVLSGQPTYFHTTNSSINTTNIHTNNLPRHQTTNYHTNDSSVQSTNIHTNNLPRHQTTNYHTNDSSVQSTNFQTNNLPRHQTTNYHTNDSSVQSTNFQTNNSSSHSTNFQTNNLSTRSSNFHTNNSTSAATNHPTVPPRYGDFVNYSERITTYGSWPHQTPTSKQLCEAGFFFTNDADLVRCFQCGIGLKDFAQEDDPLLEHVRHSGKCPYLPQYLGEERLASIRRHLRLTDPEFYRRMQLNGELNPDELSTYRHPEYRTMEARLSSFTNWPRDMIQTPQRLAEAGLYYIGIEDHVRCFACDGGLRRWDPEDDPWTEHCRWFPACPFAIEQKGEQFIALVQASVENERFEASGGGGDNDGLVGAMERLRVRESETETVMKQHDGPICRDMGFEKTELKDAVLELNERGNKNPSIEDIVDVIEIIRDRKYADLNNESNPADESPTQFNIRMKNQVYCMKCKKNKTNALFLPCTHHKLCMSCSEPLQTCPVCRRTIKEKIRTYMV